MPQLLRFSIITAVRNGALTIGDALASLHAQMHPPFEHVVIDAVSTDQTLEIVRSQRVPGTRILSERDRGIYDAFNKGVQLATGDVIAFLNADDYYIGPHVLANVAAEFVRSGAPAVFGDVQFVRPEDPTRIVRRYRSSAFLPRRLRMGIMPAHPALFVRRDLFRRYGAFDTSYEIAGDFEFVARIFGRYETRFSYLPEVLVTMRTGGISTRGRRSTLTISREILRACRENGIRTNRFLIAARLFFKAREVLRV